MKKYIHIPMSERKAIAKTLGVTQQSVKNAITYDPERGNTPLAKRIRKMAMEKGGVVMVTLPEVETLFDHDGYMHQYMPNGAEIIVDKDGTGDCTVTHGGKELHWKAISVKQLGEIQKLAASLR